MHDIPTDSCLHHMGLVKAVRTANKSLGRVRPQGNTSVMRQCRNATDGLAHNAWTESE